MTPQQIAQGQLDAYNAQDLDAYMRFFTDDCVIADLNGAVTTDGAPAIRARYEKAFAQFPHNKAHLMNRIIVGGTVVDHEDVVRAPGGERFEIIAIYTLRGDKISKVDFAK